MWVGTRPYEPVLRLQERLCAARATGRIVDTVVLLEHTPVVTLGRGADPSHVLFDKETLSERGVDVVTTNRGGDVTLHAPGQLVAYPIFDLSPDRRDVRRYVRDLAETMRRMVLRHGISAGTVPDLIGLWVDRASIEAWPGPEHAVELAKIGAIGVRVSRWVTMHGFALNLSPETDLFRLIVPCGIANYGVTSVLDLTRVAPDMRAEAEATAMILADVFDARCRGVEDLGRTDLDAL